MSNSPFTVEKYTPPPNGAADRRPKSLRFSKACSARARSAASREPQDQASLSSPATWPSTSPQALRGSGAEYIKALSSISPPSGSS